MNKLKELPSVDELQEMAAKAHAINVKNGFWEKPRDTEDLVFLMKSEVFEAGEGYRKGKNICEVTWGVNFDPVALKGKKTLLQGLLSEKPKEVKKSKSYFDNQFKETIEMEIADTIIRIFDAMMGFNIPFVPLKKVAVGDKDSLNVFIQLDKLIHPLYDMTFNKDIVNQCAVILSYLFSYDENMTEYINVKTIYNSTRGYMHGGKKA